MFSLSIPKLIALMASVTITIHAKQIDTRPSLEDLFNIIVGTTTTKLPEKPRIMTISCTGVYVAPKTVLTANHCIEDLYKDNLWIKDGKKNYSGTVLFTSKGRDLALIHVAGPNHAYATLGDPVDMSDSVYSYNSGYDMIGTFNQGYIENILPDYETNEMQYVTSLGIAQGASGGGMFNKDGELIGIMVAVLKDAPVSFAMETTVVEAFLEDGQQFLK